MAYGFMIRPDDNAKAVDISTSSRVLGFLGNYNVAGANATGNTSVNVPINAVTTGGVAVAIPTKTAWIDSSNNPTRANLLRGITVSGNNMNVQFYQGTAFREPYVSIADISLFEIPGANQNLESYGIAMYDSANFLALTDVSRFGYVTWRGVISVAGTWTIPDWIPNRSTCVVFARWNNTVTPLYHDRETNQIRTYTAFGSASGSQIGGQVDNIQIVIVSTGFSPAPPDSGYGVLIRNASGVITYSSKYPPVIWRGGYFGFPYYLENSTSQGAKIQWVGASGNVALPMVPLGSYGFQCGDYTTAETYPKRVCMYSGLLMSGNSVSTYRAKPANGMIYYQNYPVMGQIGYNLACLDAADYF